MKDLKAILNSQKILLVTPDMLNHDIVAATIVLGNMLTEKGKEVWTLTNRESFDKYYSEKYKEGNIKLTERVESTQFYISFPQNREVSDIQLEKNKEEYKIVVDTKSGKLVDSTFTFKRENLKFDLVILVAFNSANSSREFKNNFQQDFKTKLSLKLHYINNNINTNTEYIEHASSISEVVQILAEEIDYKISPEYATYLLTGMLFNTQNFQINTDKRTIKNLYQLVNKHGARLKVANDAVHEKISKEQLVWFSEIFKNLEVNGYFAYSHIDSQIDSRLLSTLNNEDKVPIFKVSRCKVALVTVNLNNTLHGLLRTDPETISALDLTSRYDRVGDSTFIHFWTSESRADVLNHFNKILNIGAPVAEEVEPVETIVEAEDENEDEVELVEESIKETPDSEVPAKTYWEKFNLQTLPSTITGVNMNKPFEQKFTPNGYNPLPVADEDEEF